MKKLILILITSISIGCYSQTLVTPGMTPTQFRTAINNNLHYLINHIDPDEVFDTLKTSATFNQLYRLNTTWKKLSGYVGTTLTDSIYYGQKGVNMRLAINTNFTDLYTDYNSTKNTFIYIKPTVTSLTNINIAKVYSNSSNETLYRSTDGLNFTSLGAIGTSYNDNTISTGTLYYYRAIGEGRSSNVYKIAVIPAYTFSAGQSISIPQTVDNNFDMSSAFSIEMWIQTPTTLAEKTYLLRTDGTDTLMIWTGFQSATFNIRASNVATSNELWKWTATEDYQFVSGGLSANTFQHWILTYDGSMDEAGLKFYCNGLLANAFRDVSNTLSTALTFSNSPWIFGNSTAKQGMIRFFNKELSQAEVTTLWNNGIPSYEDATTGKIAEYKMNDLTDTYGNTATTTGTQTFISHAKGFPIVPQLYTGATGYVFDEHGLGNYGTYFSASDNWSPFIEYRNYPSGILSQNNKTYISWHAGGNRPYSFENIITRMNNETSVLDKNLFLVPGIEGGRDGHDAISMIQKRNSTNFITVQTKWHEQAASPLLFREVDTTLKTVTILPDITQTYRFDYPKCAYLHDTLYVFGRGGWGGDRTRTAFYQSTNDGQSWSQGHVINIFENTLVVQSLVDVMKYDTSVIHLLIARLDVGNYTTAYPLCDWSYLKSRDGHNWYNVDSSYTQNITTDTISYTDMANYRVASDTGLNHGWDIHSWDFDDNGNPVFLTRSWVTDSLQFYYYDSGWKHKNINMVNKGEWTMYGVTWGSFGQIVAKGGDNYDLFIGKTIDADLALMKFTTTNAFTSFSDSIRLSPVGQTVWYPHKTFNWTPGGWMTIAANTKTTATPSYYKTNMFLYVYKP